MLKACRTPGPTALKTLSLGQYVWKIEYSRKSPRCTKTASNLQLSDLHLNAYKSLPGDQDIFSLLFSCIYIHSFT